MTKKRKKKKPAPKGAARSAVPVPAVQLVGVELDLARLNADQLGAELQRVMSEAEHEWAAAKLKAADRILLIGRILTEAKSRLTHGEWEPWVREFCPFEERQAQRYIAASRRALRDSKASPGTLLQITVSGKGGGKLIPGEAGKPPGRRSAAPKRVEQPTPPRPIEKPLEAKKNGVAEPSPAAPHLHPPGLTREQKWALEGKWAVTPTNGFAVVTGVIQAGGCILQVADRYPFLRPIAQRLHDDAFELYDAVSDYESGEVKDLWKVLAQIPIDGLAVGIDGSRSRKKHPDAPSDDPVKRMSQAVKERTGEDLERRLKEKGL